MQQNKNINRIAMITLSILVGWCLVIAIFTNYDRIGFYFWGGLSFGFLSFIVAEVSFVLTKTKNSRDTTEINYIPIYYTCAYLVISVILNTYFVFRLSGKFNLLVVASNLVILIIFVSIRLFTNDYVERVGDQTKYSVDKVSPITNISTQLAVLLSITVDTEIKKQLLTLKQLVDYSSNVSQNIAQNSENLFLLQLEQIHNMLIENRDKAEINNKIKEATITWKTRNNVVANN